VSALSACSVGGESRKFFATISNIEDGQLLQWLTVFPFGDQTMATPAIRTTVVGSYPVPDWLAALPSQQALMDATRVVFKTQEMAGIDVVVDGELYRFDVNHPDTNGMIEYFIRPMSGIRSEITRADIVEFSKIQGMGFRAEPAGVVEGPIDEGTLNLLRDYRRARSCTDHPMKFTLTGPHMLCNCGTRPAGHSGGRSEHSRPSR
jgi:methionine synthase II (cobalamin-independent)